MLVGYPASILGNGWIIDRQRVERFLAGREDAAGRPLIHETPTTDAPALTLLPERIPDTTETALTWLRGAQAAMELLVGAATSGAERGYRAGHRGHRGVAPFCRGQKARKRSRGGAGCRRSTAGGKETCVIWRLSRH